MRDPPPPPAAAAGRGEQCAYNHDTGCTESDRIDRMGPCPPEKSTPNRGWAHALACGFSTSDTHACADAAAPAFKVRVLAQLMAGTTARPPLTPPEIWGLHISHLISRHY